MANICDTDYRLTASPRKALADLWSTFQEKEVNKHDVSLCELAERYGIDYEKKGISVRGHIYWAEYEENVDDDCALLSFATESAWSSCDMFFDELNKSLGKYGTFDDGQNQYNDVLNDEETRNVVKEIVLKCQLSIEKGRFNVEYAQFLIHFLKDYNDNDFAIAINRKLIDALNQGYYHKNFEGLYGELFDKYRDVIWDDFAEAFANDDKYGFIFQINDEIGFGFGFGEGKLFQVDDGRIKELCIKHPETVPCRIANMVPVFNEASGFSDWVMWLLDNYGDNKDVLDGLHSNMNTYSWSGSVVPHLEELKLCMEGIKEHHRPEVRQWAENCIRDLDEQLKREMNRE